MRTKTRVTQYRKSCSCERRHGKTREPKDKDGNIILSKVKICDVYDPYWRVEFSDGDWEELTRRELRHGITLAAEVSLSAEEVYLPTAVQLLAPRASSWGGCGGSGADGSSSSFTTILPFRWVQILYRGLARRKDKTRFRSPF